MSDKESNGEKVLPNNQTLKYTLKNEMKLYVNDIICAIMYMFYLFVNLYLLYTLQITSHNFFSVIVTGYFLVGNSDLSFKKIKQTRCNMFISCIVV